MGGGGAMIISGAEGGSSVFREIKSEGCVFAAFSRNVGGGDMQ